MRENRPDVIRRIYSTALPDELTNLLAKWKIGYIFLGPKEIQRYGLAAERVRFLNEHFKRLYQQDDVVLYDAETL